MTTSVTYVPASPARVQTVDRLRLYLSATRIGTPTVDVGPATDNGDGTWTFTFPTPADGVYYSIITTTYTDGQVNDDKNDILQVPAPPELQAGEAWVAAWELDTPDDPNAPDAAKAASTILFALSGRKYPGIARVTEQYDLTEWGCGSVSSYLAQTEAFLQHRIRGLRDAWSGRPDPRYRFDYIRLKRRPVRDIVEVRFGPDYAAAVDPDEYAVRDRSVIEFYTGVRQETRVTYHHGTNPPAAGRLAARVLANELIKGYNQDSTCRLPDRVTSVSRQGVSFTIADTQDFLTDGRTGIYEIDLFLKAVNPDKARKRPRVFTPDLPRARRIG